MDIIRKGTRQITELRTEQTPYIVYPALETIEGFKHGFSTRAGGGE